MALATLRFLAVGVFLLSPAAFANLVNMKLDHAGNNIQGGVYIGPYEATINGQVTKVICDDFNAHTYVGQTWTANEYTFDEVASAKFGGQTNAVTKYKQAAWLTSQLLDQTSCSGTTTQINKCLGEIQFSLWDIFTPTSVPNGFISQERANWWIAEANTAIQNLGDDYFANFKIYTPTTAGSPQEFIVRTPEAPAVAFLALNFIGLMYFVRRARRQTNA